MIAALYVETGGVYCGLPDVDPWDAARDARLYRGPHPVVAHPPCKRWGRYWHGGPLARERMLLGDDAGCFAAALWAVRTFGGVLEHPEASAAWGWFGLRAPPRHGGWWRAADGRGWTCCVEQGHYGHRARKATWLYAVGTELPDLKWGPSAAKVRLDDGFHSAEERADYARGRSLYNDPPAGMSADDRACRRRFLERRAALGGKEACAPEQLSAYERLATPLAFRDVLLGIARSAQPVAQIGALDS